MRPTDGTPKRGGTLKIAGGTTTSPHFDLHQGATVHPLTLVYNNLVRKDLTDGFRTLIPDLAQKWDISADKLTYTFTMRDGVKFHDGTPFTSADVVATFNRILNPPQGVASVFRSQIEMVDKVDAPDPKTARFVLKHPSLVFMEVLTQPAMIVYSKKAIDENGGDLRKAVAPGTGAFIYKDYKQGEKWSFAKNPEYWDKELPYVDAIEMIDTPQLSDRGTAVLTGQADMTWNGSVDTWKEGQQRKDTLTVAQIPNFGAHTAHINNEKGPLADKRVRRAIHLAVSREEHLQSVREPGANFPRTLDVVRLAGLKHPGGDREAARLSGRQVGGHRRGQEADGRGRLRERVRSHRSAVRHGALGR